MYLKEIYRLIRSDYMRYIDTPKREKLEKSKFRLLSNILLCAMIAKNHCFAYSFYLRLSSRKNPFRLIAKWKHYRLSRKYGIQIPSSTRIGEGLYIGHGIGIVINGGSIIGKNCNISQFLSIGTNKRTPAIIGDNVYIGPHVSIVEDVKIGNNVKIGAGTVVINDIPDNCTSVGNPNRVIRKEQS